jgi:hypothetical protein
MLRKRIVCVLYKVTVADFQGDDIASRLGVV